MYFKLWGKKTNFEMVSTDTFSFPIEMHSIDSTLNEDNIGAPKKGNTGLVSIASCKVIALNLLCSFLVSVLCLFS